MFRKRLLAGLLALIVLPACSMIYPTPALAWTYQIQNGDSLYKISQKYGTSVNDLKQVNRLKSDLILSGKKLWIPENQSQTMHTSRGQDDLYLLARLISGEARGESYEGQVAVGAVIMNRLEDGDFPKTIAGNVFKKGEFESVSNGQIWNKVTDQSLKAAKAALSGNDPTGGALYFYNPSKIHSKYSWIWSRQVTGRIGRHVFAV